MQHLFQKIPHPHATKIAQHKNLLCGYFFDAVRWCAIFATHCLYVYKYTQINVCSVRTEAQEVKETAHTHKLYPALTHIHT